jgi:OOP family OmpA-OmpF porin
MIQREPKRMTSRRKFVLAALALSLVLHGTLLYFFTDIRVGSFAIPAEKHHFPVPLRLKRVEIPAANLEQSAPAPVPPPPDAKMPPATLPEAPATAAEALQAGPPNIEAPTTVPGNPAGFTPALPAPPAAVSPYSLDDHAKVEAEIAKFSVGPTSPGLAAPAPAVASVPGAVPAEGSPGAGQDGTTPSPSALPSLSQITTQFRTPAPALNPNLPQPVVLVLPTDILFDFDSARLHPGAEATLGKALDYIRKYARADVEVDGHTDTFGAAAYNDKLSLDRARTVADWLRGHLSPSEFTLESRGFGSRRPVADPKGSIAEQQRNRRVELVLRALAQ